MTDENENEFLTSQSTSSLSNEGYEKESIYKFDGVEFIKLDINKDVIKVPITREADMALKEIRKVVSADMATRPDLSIVASAVLIHALNLDNLSSIVRSYGARVYQVEE
ncbi:hypothetical protein [Janthinobacterium sp. MDT1-19]|uniref:hypothetical protein n=1 Tax=Janthinobacterium sp. MDT1-19 TaxID=1259339 RepID=UPI003F23D4AE